MGDFNHDNQNIDTALTALRMEVEQKTGPAEVAAAQMWVKIGEASLHEAAGTLSITAENAEQYIFYLLCFDTLGSGQVNMSWSGYPDSYTIANSTSGTDVHYSGVCQIITLPNGGLFLWNSTAARNSTTTGTNSNHYSTETMLPEASNSGSITITLTPRTEQKWAAGSYLVIFGLKK